jgi:hypothetical protein
MGRGCYRLHPVSFAAWAGLITLALVESRGLGSEYSQPIAWVLTLDRQLTESQEPQGRIMRNCRHRTCPQGTCRQGRIIRNCRVCWATAPCLRSKTRRAALLLRPLRAAHFLPHISPQSYSFGDILGPHLGCTLSLSAARVQLICRLLGTNSV